MIDNPKTELSQSGLVRETKEFLEHEKNQNKAAQNRWKLELQHAINERRDMYKVAKKAIQVYQSKIHGPDGYEHVRYNIYHTYLQTIKRVTFARIPKIVVKSLPGHDSEVTRKAETLLERNIQHFFTCPEYRVFKKADKAVFDLLTSAQGVLWPRYEFKETGKDKRIDLKPGEVPPENIEVQEEVLESGEKKQYFIAPEMEYEKVHIDYVHHRDYLESVAKSQSDIRWRAKRVMLTRDAVIETFGEEVAAKVERNYKNQFHEPYESSGDIDSERHKVYARLEVWEIQSLEERKIYFICPDAKEPLAVKDDFLGLDDFFSTPPPMCLNVTNETTVPNSDYKNYGYLCDKINNLTVRINILTDAVKVAGVYDGSVVDMKAIFNQLDTSMMPAQDWHRFAEDGGFDGVVQFVPIDQFVKGIQGLSEQRERFKQDFYEISAFTATMRDQVEASQSSAAIQQAGQFTNLRNSDRQGEVQMYLRDIAQVVGEIICKQFSIETMIQIAGEFPEEPQDMALLEAAYSLLQSAYREFAIEISTDSTIAIDEVQEKRDRIEFMNMAGQFLNQVMGLIQTSPAFVPAAIEMFLFALDTFRVGRPVEDKLVKGLEQFVMELQQQQEQPPPPNPDMEKIKAQVQMKQMELQFEEMKLQFELEQKQSDSMMKFQIKQVETQQAQFEFQQKMQMDWAKFQAELQYKYAMIQGQITVANVKAQSDYAIKQVELLQSEKENVARLQWQGEIELAKEDIRADNAINLEAIRSQAKVETEQMKGRAQREVETKRMVIDAAKQRETDRAKIEQERVKVDARPEPRPSQ